jgi:hypothetical protein
MTIMEFLRRRPLFLARLGLLTGFALMLVVNLLWIVYVGILVSTRGDPGGYSNIFDPVQTMVLTIDIVAGGFLVLGFWWFGKHHDTIGNQAQNMGIAFAIWTIVTLAWRLRLLWTPADEVNPISTRLESGEYGLFIPHFEFFRLHYLGFLLSGIIMFIIMLMMVRLIRNYRVYESYQGSIRLNLFRAYGLIYLIGVVMMGLGWLAFNPASAGTTVGVILQAIYIIAWLIMFMGLPILGLWVFFPAFNIHRSAIETLGFILRRKAERERGAMGEYEETVAARGSQ